MHFPYGELQYELPGGCLPSELWPELWPQPISSRIIPSEVLPGPTPIVRWGFWPLYFELHLGDAPPDLMATKKRGRLTYSRIVVWQRSNEVPLTTGWYTFSKKPRRIDGYFTFTPQEPYENRWKKKVRKEVHHWRRYLNIRYRIDEVTAEEYIEFYLQSATLTRAGHEPMEILHAQMGLPGAENLFRFWVTRDIEDNQVTAGLCASFSPTTLSSEYRVPFITTPLKSGVAMTGLVDHWFKTSEELGIKHLSFTHFWRSGLPKRQKGYSKFKSKFGLTYVANPPLAFRFVWGKLW